MKALEIALLIIPAVLWKLWKDRNGTVHPNNEPIVVWIIMCVSTALSGLIEISYTTSIHDMINQHHYSWFLILKCLSISITGYALIFPYAFNVMWSFKYHNYNDLADKLSNTTILKDRLKYVLTHLSETAIPDKYFLKYNVHWLVRLLLYVTLFSLSLYWFW